MKRNWDDRVILLVMIVTMALVAIAYPYFTSDATPETSSTAIVVRSDAQQETELLDGINAKRAENGKAPLVINDKLNQSAQLKADDMIAKDYWSHDAPDGAKPWAFFARAGYEYQKAGENLAKCYDDEQATVEAWYASPTHKANILGDYTDTGFGWEVRSNGCIVVVNHFGKP